MDVVVVNHNTRELLRACLESVFANNPAQVVVVDTGSSDMSADMVASEYPEAELIADDSNPGYGASANQGVSRCQDEYILILNSDTRLHAGALRALSDYFDTASRAGLVGPLLTGDNGVTQQSDFRMLAYHSAAGLLLYETSASKLRDRILSVFNLEASGSGKPGKVEWVVGAALAVRRDAFMEVGGFDEDFFMYSEEVDLCYRLRQAGWEIHFAPVTAVVHVRGASTKQYPAKMIEENYKSRLQFSRKHYSYAKQVEFAVAITYVMVRNMARTLVDMRRARSMAERTRAREHLQSWGRVLRDAWRRQTPPCPAR